MKSKIEKELNELVAAQVITPEVHVQIKRYYECDTDERPNKLFAVFGVLGALLTGLGIILILAHNWDNFSRAIKTIWAFAPLLMGQLFVGYTLLKKKSTAWKETAAVFLFFAIGASISLVSQTYNIPGKMSTFLLTWILLAAPLIYLLKSHAATLLHLLFATIYVCNVGYFNNDNPYLYLVLLAWIVPFYARQIKFFPTANLTGILNWALPLSMLISLGAFVSGEDTLGFVMYVSLFGFFYNVGCLPYFRSQKMRKNGYLIIGSVGTIVTLLIASFSFVWEIDSFKMPNTSDLYITIALCIVSIAIIAYLFKIKRLAPFNLFQYAFVLFAIIYGVRFLGDGIPTILTNILILALGVFTIEMGARKNRYSVLNYGLIIITSLITCRFFDTEISFVIRGLLFVAIGAGFFLANYYMHQKSKRSIAKSTVINSKLNTHE